MDLTKLKDYILQKDFYKRLFIILIGTYLLALDYNLFLLPNHFVIGGTSGLAIIFEELFGWNPNLFLYFSSFVLIILSFSFLGFEDTKVSIIGSLFYPVMVSFTAPVANFLRPYLTFDNILITIIIASVLYGLANGIIYKVGFNTGGSDILMKIVNRYFHLPESKSLVILNGTIILFGGFVFGINNVIYAIIILLLYTKIVDNILVGVSNSKLFFIYTKEHQKVEEHILKVMKTGVTLLETEGGYSKEKGYMLMCVVPTKDYYLFKEIVLNIDPNAFFVIHDCYEVHGGKRKKNKIL